MFVYVLSANDFEKGLLTSESHDIIKQYLCFTLNENHDDDDDESDCINADDINDDDSSIDVKILITLITTLFIIKMQ